MLCKYLSEFERVCASFSPGDIDAYFDTLIHGFCTWFENDVSSESCFTSFLYISTTKCGRFACRTSCAEFLRIPTCAIDANWCRSGIGVNRESFII